MKFGLCIGLNYSGTSNELSGCIPDVHRMKKFLIANGFLVDVLTDQYEPVQTDYLLARMLGFVQKVNDSPQNSKVVIHYSGHGSYIPDFSGDETDNRDEVICTSNGFITDDVLHKCISKFKKGTRIFCIFDSCHSGSILDLKYCNGNLENRKCIIKNDVCAISGCRDSETSTDLSFPNGNAGGLLTMSFLETFRLDCEIIRFVNMLRWKTKKYNQKPEYTHTIQKPYHLRHFF